MLHSLHDSLQVQARRFLFFLIPNNMILRFFFFSFSFQTKWCYVSFSFLSHSKQNDVTFLFIFFLIPNKMISTFFLVLVHPREYQMTRLYETNPKNIYSSFFYFGSQKNKTFLFFSSFGILVFIIIETILRRDDSHFSTFSFAIIWMVKYSVFITRE